MKGSIIFTHPLKPVTELSQEELEREQQRQFERARENQEQNESK